MITTLLLATLTFASNPLHRPDDGVTGTEILIGIVNAQTGPAQGLGKGMLAGAKAAFDAVNEAGGIHGRKIKLLVEDDGYEPNKTVDATIKMVEENKVFCLFGYVGTPTSLAAMPIVKDAHVPLVGLFTGSGALRKPVTAEVVNVRASYGDETEALVERFTKDLGVSKIAVFHQNDAFGQAVLAGVQNALKKRSMALVGKGTFERNTVAVESGLADILKASPDLVVMAGPYAPLAEFIKKAKGNGLKAHLATVSFVGTESLLQAVGEAGNGVVISQVMPSPDGKDQVVRDAIAAVAKSAPGTNLGYVNLEGYISALTLVRAIREAGQDLTRTKLLAAIESMKAVDFGGFSVSFSPDDHQGSHVVYTTVIRGGHAIQVDTLQ